ncbi:hypothetical protein DKT77_05445 [Meridianimarinicoccus roseus]|uniref:HTH DNA binding domain-containing protein n=1 Tax=Meridianimarinicoccus roseus TaxID=2072018 RepID=A0A2V2LDI1_9RHOB|nr:hypothetical protein DKT77_05445 [Meridianimarinicoccus roseus]
MMRRPPFPPRRPPRSGFPGGTDAEFGAREGVGDAAESDFGAAIDTGAGRSDDAPRDRSPSLDDAGGTDWRGPYDPDPDAAEDDLWFMPAPPDDDAAPGDMPWLAGPARGTGAELPQADDWARAEAGCAAALARTALAVGALDDRLRCGPAGLRRRLICAEVADLGWHLGDRVTVDRLALYLVLRLAALGEDAQSLARAAWAQRRLDHAGLPDLSDPAALSAFLGREAVAGLPGAELITRPMGTEFDALVHDWAREVETLSGRHPFVVAAAAWQGWRARGLSGDLAEVEGGVLAAKIAAQALRTGGMGFVPLSLGGGDALRASGDASARLGAWLRGIEQAALRGLMECDRLAAWLVLAEQRIAPLSGRTPSRLVAALLDWPLASAPMLEAQTGASRAAVQRNMLRFEDLGLVREVTGQARFRFWRAAV